MLPIKKVTNINPSFKGLVYGESGAGKTFLCCTMPKPLIIIVELHVSDMTILAAQRLLGVEPDVLHVQSLDDIEDAYDLLSSGKHDYKSVCLDSLTDIQQKLTRHLVDTAYALNPRLDPVSPDISNWGRTIDIMRDLVARFRDLPMHVLMTAILDEKRAVEGEIIRCGPLMRPKSLSYEVPRFFTHVGVLAARETDKGQRERRILFGPSDFYVTKNPGELLDNVVVNPNMGEIIETITGGVGSGKATA